MDFGGILADVNQNGDHTGNPICENAILKNSSEGGGLDDSNSSYIFIVHISFNKQVFSQFLQQQWVIMSHDK